MEALCAASCLNVRWAGLASAFPLGLAPLPQEEKESQATKVALSWTRELWKSRLSALSSEASSYYSNLVAYGWQDQRRITARLKTEIILQAITARRTQLGAVNIGDLDPRDPTIPRIRLNWCSVHKSVFKGVTWDLERYSDHLAEAERCGALTVGTAWMMDVRLWRAAVGAQMLGWYATEVKAALKIDEFNEYKFGSKAKLNFSKTPTRNYDVHGQAAKVEVKKHAYQALASTGVLAPRKKDKSKLREGGHPVPGTRPVPQRESNNPA